MTAILLLQLIAQPAADDTSRLEETVSVQLGKVYELMEDDPDGALRLLNALLDDPKTREGACRSLSIRIFREQAVYCRAQIQLQQENAHAVVEDMTALL